MGSDRKTRNQAVRLAQQIMEDGSGASTIPHCIHSEFRALKGRDADKKMRLISATGKELFFLVKQRYTGLHNLWWPDTSTVLLRLMLGDVRLRRLLSKSRYRLSLCPYCVFGSHIVMKRSQAGCQRSHEIAQAVFKAGAHKLGG